MNRSLSGVRAAVVAWALVWAYAGSAAAQQTRVLSGVVVNAAGDPLAGAVVRVEGTTLGALSDARGASGFRVFRIER